MLDEQWQKNVYKQLMGGFGLVSFAYVTHENPRREEILNMTVEATLKGIQESLTACVDSSGQAGDMDKTNELMVSARKVTNYVRLQVRDIWAGLDS